VGGSREPVLVGAAELWIVSNPVSLANAIVVETRSFAVAELCGEEGLPIRSWFLRDQRSGQSACELNREILLKLGVPVGAIESFGTASRNTRDEARALRKWAELNGGSVCIITREIFSTRRVRWIFRREF
jgi:hypothetical protein